MNQKMVLPATNCASSDAAVTCKFALRDVLANRSGRITLACGFIASSVVLMASGFRLEVFAACAALIGLSCYAAHLIISAEAQQLLLVEQEARRHTDRLVRLSAQSAPIWIRQIETVREESDAEIAKIARTFGSIASRLEELVGPAWVHADRQASCDPMMALAENEKDLHALVTMLAAMEASKEAIVDDVALQAERLRDTAAEIRHIALTTRIVALNATIEAARAGAEGKPFSVVVGELRSLSSRMATVSDQLSRETDRLNGMVSEAFSGKNRAHAAVSIEGPQTLARRVMDRRESAMAELARAIENMQQERLDVRAQVSSVLVALQFQDRTSQILSHVTHNLRDMQSEIKAGRWISMDERCWIDRMAASYSTPEEFINKDGLPRPMAARDPGITFF